jgi:hypothetical protein
MECERHLVPPGSKPGRGTPATRRGPARRQMGRARLRYPELAEAYARAREQQQHLRADEILAIADNGTNDWLDHEMRSGRIAKVYNHEHAKRTDIRIRTRMWLMQRFAPKTFGDRLQLDAGAETIEALAARSPEERLADAKALIARAKRRVAEAYESGEVSDADYSEDE